MGGTQLRKVGGIPGFPPSVSNPEAVSENQTSLSKYFDLPILKYLLKVCGEINTASVLNKV